MFKTVLLATLLAATSMTVVSAAQADMRHDRMMMKRHMMMERRNHMMMERRHHMMMKRHMMRHDM